MTDFTERYPGAEGASDRQPPAGRDSRKHLPVRRVGPVRGPVSGPDAVPDLSSLQARRRQLRQSQEETAFALDVSLSTYQRWERGEQRPHGPSQRRLGEHFSVSFAVLDAWFPHRPRT